MSTSANQRANMRKMKWGIRQVNMTVAQDSRDLGAHINTIRQVRNGTLAARMKEATQLVRRITFMPVPRTRKRIVINGKAIPKALYGAEVTPVPKKHIAELATAMVDAIMPKNTTRRSQDIFWVTAMDGYKHPMTHVHIRRVDKFRTEYERADPRIRQIFENVQNEYKRRRNQDHKGKHSKSNFLYFS